MFSDLKKVLIISLVLILFAGSAYAYDGSILKDYYFDVNENEVIYLYPYLENYTAYFYNDMEYQMDNDSVKYEVWLANNETGDVPFSVVLFWGDVDHYNNSDYEQDDSLTISNTSSFYYSFDFTSNKTAGEVGSYTICAYLKKSPSSADSTIRFFAGYNNSGIYHLDYSMNVIVDSLNFMTYCDSFIRTYDHNVSVGDIEIFGFVCDSCDTTSLVLGLDSDELRNKSFFSSDLNVSEQNNFTDDFMIFTDEYERIDGSEIFFFNEVMRWREPYHVNFSFYNEYTDDTGSIIRESYGNDNMIMYAVPYTEYDTYMMDDVFSATIDSMPDFGVNYDMLGFGDYKTKFVFTHDRLDSNGLAEMKFYNPNNYSLYLRNIKFFDETKQIDEFAKPVYDTSDIDYFLDIMVINQSTTYSVFFDELQLRIWEVYRNAIFYFVGFLLWGLLVGLLVYLGLDLKIIAGGSIGLLVIIFGGISAIL